MSRAIKDSGIPWIGEIPKEWMFLRFKFAGKFVKGKLPETSNNENIGLPIIGASEILGKECRLYTEDVNIPTCTLNDVIILWDGANAGITATNLEGVISSTAVKYSCKDNRVYKKYMAFLMKYAEYYFKEKVGGTTIPHMNIEYINDFPLLCPTLDEQRAIADFLDVKCAEVDELIALQEKMIDELKVYKQSVITEAVTKGLNPDVPLKDSGIEWIGQIPEHWRMKKLKNILRTSLQYGANESGIPYNENLPRYVRITDITTDNTLKEDIDKQSLTEKQAKGYILKDKDILFARSGATVGKSFMYNQHYGICAFAGYLIKASIDIYNSPKFIHYYTLTHSYEEWKKQIFIQATIQNIGADRYAQLILPIPPIEEQQQIADYLDTKCVEIDEMTSIKQL